MDEKEDASATIALPPATAEQLRRALVLLDLSGKLEDADAKFIQCVAALHLARAVPEYWYTVAENISIDSGKKGTDRNALKQRLLNDFENVFRTSRRYDLLSTLRQWDYHWEPIRNPRAFGPGAIYGRGAPVRLATGPGPGSVVFQSGNQMTTTGSGHRVGRSNYYRIQHSRFVDFASDEAVPLELAIRQFIEDLPRCVAEILKWPEVIQYLMARE